MVVAAAGNVDHDLVTAGIERRFGGRPGDAPARIVPNLAPPLPLSVVRRSTEQAHLIVGMRSIDRDDPDRYALAVLNQIVGGGMSSRLFQEIREKRGLVYSVYSYRAAYLETGAFAIYAGTGPDKARQVLDIIDAELDKLLADGVTDRELAVAKGHLKGSMALSLEDSAGRMNRIGRSQLLHGEVVPFAELVARTEAVDHDAVRRVIDRVLGNERVLAVVGPFSEDDFAERVA